MMKKLMVLILTFTFLLSGCSNDVLPIIDNNSTSDNHFILGSAEYVEKINNIVKKSGNRSALSAIMIDVKKNGNELDNNSETNISRFHILVSSVIYKIGYVDIQTHYFRISYDGFYEAVYNEKGILLNENNDPINMGTYNYAAKMPKVMLITTLLKNYPISLSTNLLFTIDAT